MFTPLIVLLACGGPSGELEPATFTVNERVPSVINASWSSKEGGEARLEWGYDDRLSESSQSVSVEAGEQSMRLIGPVAGYRVFVRAVLETDDGERLTSDVNIIDLPLAPSGMARMYTEGAPSQEGALLTTILTEDSPWVVLLNRDGEPIWYYPLPLQSLTTAVLPTRDGEGLLVLWVDLEAGDGSALLRRVSWDGEVEGTMELFGGHHDVRELPDDRIAWLQAELREVELMGETELVKGDVLRISEWGADPDEMRTETPVLSLLDVLPTPTSLCEHQSRLTNFFGQSVVDLTHANSIDYDPDTEELLVLTHFVDALVSVPVTGGEAKVISTLTGYTTPDGETPFSHAHSSMMRSDRALLFDNGLHYDPPLSRVVAVSWDDSDQTLWEDWSYDDPNAGVVQILGDAQPTPSGGVLASYSTFGRIIEVTESGEVVWTLESEAGAGLGRLWWMAGF